MIHKTPSRELQSVHNSRAADFSPRGGPRRLKPAAQEFMKLAHVGHYPRIRDP